MKEFFAEYGSWLDLIFSVVGFVVLWIRTRKGRMQSLDKETQEKFKTFLNLLLKGEDNNEDKK